jgi:hypothetical protein
MATQEEIEAAGRAAYKKYMQFLTNPAVLPSCKDKRDVLKLKNISEKFWQQMGKAALEAAERVSDLHRAAMARLHGDRN